MIIVIPWFPQAATFADIINDEEMETTSKTRQEDPTEETIGQIVAKDYRTAQVFKKFGIDFCCGGKITLTELSRKKGIDPGPVRKALSEVDRSSADPSIDFDHWELPFLKDYIVNTHHRYVKQSIPFISELSQKVARVHGSSHPETIQVAVLFDQIAKDLSLHLMEEENTVFPYIQKLAKAGETDQDDQSGSPSKLTGQVNSMESEHEQAGKDLEAIKALTNGYKVPADACASYRVLYRSLEEFENDLHQHVHLENNILFPKAISLERQLTA